MSDHNPTAAPSNLIPESAALGEEAEVEHQGLLWRTEEALLLSLTMVWLLGLEEDKAEKGLEGSLIKNAGTEYKIRFHAGGAKAHHRQGGDSLDAKGKTMCGGRALTAPQPTVTPQGGASTGQGTGRSHLWRRPTKWTALAELKTVGSKSQPVLQAPASVRKHWEEERF